MYVYYQVRQGQDGWILTKFFFMFLLKERGQCTAILTKQTWSIRDLLYGQKRAHLALPVIKQLQ